MKLFMMPHTVPNRPTNGRWRRWWRARRCRATRCAPSRPRCVRAATMRSLRPSAGRFADMPTSSPAAATSLATRRAGRACPGSLPPACGLGAAGAAARARRLAPNSSSVFASHTVHVTSDANAKPMITAFTTMSALRNMPHGDRSCGSRPALIAGVDPVAAGSAVGAAAGAASCASARPANKTTLSAAIVTPRHADGDVVVQPALVVILPLRVEELLSPAGPHAGRGAAARSSRR